MREGIRRLSVALYWLGWLWLIGWGAYFTWEWWTMDVGQNTPAIGRLLIAAPALIPIVLAWILEGFAVPDDKNGSRHEA